MTDPGLLYYASLTLTDELTIQKRKVYSFMEMAGNIGGLLDIVILFISSLNGCFFEAYMRYSLARNLFIYKLPDQSYPRDRKEYRHAYKWSKRIRLSLCELIAHTFPIFKKYLSKRSRQKLKFI